MKQSSTSRAASIDPKAFDLFQFVRDEHWAIGQADAAAMPRILAEIPDDAPARDPVFGWRAVGAHLDDASLPVFGHGARTGVLDLSIDGALWLRCQRCLAPVREELALTVSYLVAATDQEANAMPLDDDRFETIVGSSDFDLVELIEEEVLLSLPLAPRHVSCPAPLPHVDATAWPADEGGVVASDAGRVGAGFAADTGTPHPFAVLATLRVDKARSEHAGEDERAVEGEEDKESDARGAGGAD